MRQFLGTGPQSVANPAAQVLSSTSAFYVTPATKILANTAAVGDCYRFTLSLTGTATIQTLSLASKVGTAGTTADASTTGMPLAAGSAATGHAVLEVTMSVRTTGSSGVLSIFYRWTNLQTAGISGTNVSAFHTTATINTTIDQFIGLALTSTVANIVTVQQAIRELVDKN